MSIIKSTVEGREVLTITDEPFITEPVLQALSEFLKNVPDVSDLDLLLIQMEGICKLHASPDFALWDEEEQMLLFLHEFFRQVRHRQRGDTIN